MTDNIMNNKYKEFYDDNRIPLLQYKSLRGNFKIMIEKVLGKDYYNRANDVYQCDKIICEEITDKIVLFESGSLFNRLKKAIRGTL